MKTSRITFVSLMIAMLLPVSKATSQDGDKYFIDVHILTPGGVKYADVADAHEKDLATQATYNVSFVHYWVDEEKGLVYCLSKAQSPEDVHTTHAEAHGLVPAEIHEVIAGEQAAYTGNGMLFLDIHDLGAGQVSAADVEEAHLKDLEVQVHYHVNFINYWVDETNGKVFCLSEAPSADAVVATHKHAHGLEPVEVLCVKQGE